MYLLTHIFQIYLILTKKATADLYAVTFFIYFLIENYYQLLYDVR